MKDQSLAHTNQTDVVGKLAEEFLDRYRNGERPPLSEYIDRHPECADDIRELFPALVLMEDVAPHDDRDDLNREEQPDPRQLGDFRIIREVGRGGMGIVYEAEQVSLGRCVALKLLPKQTLLDSRHQKRFLREARAAARLHHTNIVPVFGVGQQEGLHYYVMQFIHGLGLDDVLVELKQLRQGSVAENAGGRGSRVTETALDDSAVAVAQCLVSDDGSHQQQATSLPSRSTLDPQPSILDTTIGHLSDTFTLPGHSEQTSKPHSRSIYWRSVAHIGLQAAQALQYAHDQGIIHRDIKPGNLLLDADGSAWVTDFGLAKAADQQDLTHSGDVLGTLRYMAPEQFDGNADARSDVYSLGLTLYEMLSLKPAFDEIDRHKLVRQVTSGTPTRLRSLDRTIPRDLEMIVHKAIDREPAQRYQTAGELAADLQRFLGDEPIRARRPPVLQRLGKWTRRHRAVVSTAILCLVVAAVLLAGTIGWAVRDRAAAHAARQALLATEVGYLLEDADRLRADGRSDEALAAARRAEAVLASGDGAWPLRDRVRQALHELKMVHRLEQIRLERAVWREDGFDDSGAAASYARAFREFGVDLEVLTSVEAVSRLNEHPNIRLALVAALDDFAVTRAAVNGSSDDLRLSLVDVARRLDPDPLRDRFRAVLGRPATAAQRGELQALADRVNVVSQPPATLVMLARTLHRGGLQDSAQTLLREAQRHYPDDFWINFDLARRAAESNDHGAAVRFYSSALAARPWDNAARNNLGVQLLDQNRLDEAEATFHRAIQLDPRFVYAHSNLGNVLRERGALKEAIACYEKALELKPDYAVAENQLGIALASQYQFDEAEAAYHRAIEADPDNARAHFNLGNLLRRQKRFTEAETSYRQVIDLDYSERVQNPLGVVLFEQNRYDEAEAHFRRACELVPDDVSAHTNLGNALLVQNRFDEAEASYRRAIELDPDYANAHYNLGRLLIQQSSSIEAEASFRLAIELDAERGIELVAVETDEDGVAFRGTLGVAYYRTGHWRKAIYALTRAIELREDNCVDFFFLAMAHWQNGQTKEAHEWLRKAAAYTEELDPHNEELLRLRAEAEQLIQSGRTADAGTQLPSAPDS